MDGDDVAGQKLALVLDRLLDRRHAALVGAQELRREAERMRKNAASPSSNLPTYHMTFMWPISSQCHGKTEPL